jgi:hypothetical protein
MPSSCRSSDMVSGSAWQSDATRLLLNGEAAGFAPTAAAARGSRSLLGRLAPEQQPPY